MDAHHALTLSGTAPAARDDSMRALELLGKKGDLTVSEQLFVDVWLENFDDVKVKLGLLIDRYLDTDPSLVAELIRVSDRMDATLKGYLEREASLPFEQLEAFAMQQELREVGPPATMIEVRHPGDMMVMAEAPVPWDDFEPFECPICFDDVEQPEQGFRARDCGHKFCRACMQDNLATQVSGAMLLHCFCFVCSSAILQRHECWRSTALVEIARLCYRIL
jgi:hypothetical protein